MKYTTPAPRFRPFFHCIQYRRHVEYNHDWLNNINKCPGGRSSDKQHSTGYNSIHLLSSILSPQPSPFCNTTRSPFFNICSDMSQCGGVDNPVIRCFQTNIKFFFSGKTIQKNHNTIIMRNARVPSGAGTQKYYISCHIRIYPH